MSQRISTLTTVMVAYTQSAVLAQTTMIRTVFGEGTITPTVALQHPTKDNRLPSAKRETPRRALFLQVSPPREHNLIVHNHGSLSSLDPAPHQTFDTFPGVPVTPSTFQFTPCDPPTLRNRIASFFRPRNIIPTPVNLPTVNDIFGNSMAIPLHSHTTRLYFINLNGINLANDAVKYRDLCKELKTSQIDLFAAVEHNLDTNKFSVRQRLQKTARTDIFPPSYANLHQLHEGSELLQTRRHDAHGTR